MGKLEPVDDFGKSSFTGTQQCLFLYIWSMAAFMLPWQAAYLKQTVSTTMVLKG